MTRDARDDVDEEDVGEDVERATRRRATTLRDDDAPTAARIDCASVCAAVQSDGRRLRVDDDEVDDARTERETSTARCVGARVDARDGARGVVQR